MVAFGAATERKQAFLFRLVDIANELFVMSASVARAEALRRAGRSEANQAARLADTFCRASRRKVTGLFAALWHNDDSAAYAVGREVLAGQHAWLEAGAVGLGLTIEDLRPRGFGAAQPQAPRTERSPKPAGVA